MTLKREGTLAFPETLRSSNTPESCLFEGMSRFHQYSALTQITQMLEKIQLFCAVKGVTLELQTM